MRDNEASRFTRLVHEMRKNRIAMIGSGIVICVICIAISAPLIAPRDPFEVSLERKLEPPSKTYLMGTDHVGRDIFSRVIWGTRVSLQIGFLTVFIGVVGGVPLGILAGYYNGTSIEQLIMRFVDAMFSIPLLVWAIAIVGIMGVGPIRIGPFQFPNEAKLIVLVGFFYIAPIARVTYSVALVESNQDYIIARVFQGASNLKIMGDDVLRNCLSPIIVQATLFIAVSIIVEASLSFVGLGVQPPKPSWGTMLADARSYVFSGEWWLPVFPGVAISMTVIGFNLLGDALREVLDPRKKSADVMV
jgi:peptide/nickel transport system permease protein